MPSASTSSPANTRAFFGQGCRLTVEIIHALVREESSTRYSRSRNTRIILRVRIRVLGIENMSYPRRRLHEEGEGSGGRVRGIGSERRRHRPRAPIGTDVPCGENSRKAVVVFYDFSYRGRV